MPKVTIGLPVYNGARYLEQALESLCSQTWTDFELVISDNASTDRTREICRACAGRDARIRYFRHDRNLGAARNYNRVFEAARGEYFKWAAHDDLCAPTFLARCLEVLEADPGAVLAYPRTVIIDAAGERVAPYQDNLDLTADSAAERFRRYLFRRGEECNAVFGLIRREALEKTRLIEPYNASDRVLLGNLALLGRFREVPEELFFRRDHAETSLRGNADAREVAAWFDPARKRSLVLPVCRLYLELGRIVWLSGLGLPQRLYGVLQVARRLWWHRRGVAPELRQIPRSLVHLLTVRSGIDRS